MATTEESRYPWYEVVEEAPVLQGDLLDKCPVLVPKTDEVVEDENGNPTIEAEIIDYDVVIMSQSCDLKEEKVDLVLVCPVWPYEKLAQNNDFLKSTKGKESLQRGNQPGYHVLNACEIDGWNRAISVVDFRNVYGVPFPFLKRLARDRKTRLRLLPPYREHLSQAFARFFMRVGLPVGVRIP